MVDLPYTYKNRKRLATGLWRDYWRFRRDGRDTPLPGSPGDAAFHARYSELVADPRPTDATLERHTFAWLAKAYLDSTEFAALADKTQDDYRNVLDGRLTPILGIERFDCINRPAIKAIRDNVAETLSARTAHKVKQVASLLYTWAEQEDLLPPNFVNPAMGIRKIKAKSKSIEIWSPEEIELFLANCDEATKTPVLLALYTGQRREDLVQMQWSAVLGEMVRVRQNKTNEPLTIRCHRELRKHLATITTRFKGPILRGKDGKPMTANQLSMQINRAVALIDGMPHRTLHGLRYAAAGALESVGCSVVQISSIVGHRTYQMAMKYASQRKDMEAAMDKLENQA